MANNPFRRYDGIQLRPRYSSDPVQGKLGELYYNTTTNKVRVCINTSPLTWSNVNLTQGTVVDSTLHWNGSEWLENPSIFQNSLGKTYAPDAATGGSLTFQTGAATTSGNDGGSLTLKTGAGLGAGVRGILYLDTDYATAIDDSSLLIIRGGKATILGNNGGDISVAGGAGSGTGLRGVAELSGRRVDLTADLFVRLNAISASDPASPLQAGFYYSSYDNRYRYYDGTNWRYSDEKGVEKVDLRDNVNTTLPTTDPVTIDGVTLLDGMDVLFTNLSSGNAIYRASIPVPAGPITWILRKVLKDPTGTSFMAGDLVWVSSGTAYGKILFGFDGLFWAYVKLAPGTAMGSILVWDGLNWVENALVDASSTTYKARANTVADANPANNLSIQAADKTAGTGDGGDVVITGGSSFGGVAGKIRLWNVRIAAPIGGAGKRSDLYGAIDNGIDAVKADYFQIRGSDKTAGTGDGGDLILISGTSVGGNPGDVVLRGQKIRLDARYASDPALPNEADIYYNTTEDRFKYYDGTAWRPMGSGSGGGFVAQYYNSASTTLPASAPYAPDGVNVVTGDMVLFTGLTNPADNNRVYKATVTGPTITWQLQIFGQSPTSIPTDGDSVYITLGTSNADTLWYFNGTVWYNILANAANRTLSNLTSPTSINQNLIPTTHNTRDLGTNAVRWKRLYSVDLVTDTVNASAITASNSLTLTKDGNSLLITPTTGTSAGYLTLNNTGGTSFLGIEGSAGGGLATGAAAYAMVLTPATGRNLYLGYSGGAGVALTVDTSGNVGIGTASPVALLHIQTAASSPQFIIGNAGVNANPTLLELRQEGTAYWRMGIPNATDAFAIYRYGAGTYPEALRIDSSGNVGIGTTSPGTRLDIQAASLGQTTRISPTTANAYVYSEATNGTSRAFFGIENTSGNTLVTNAPANSGVFGTITNHPIVLATNAITRMTVDTSGNVLVGATSQFQSALLSAYGSIAARNGGVNGTFANAFIAGYNASANEHNVIQTAVSSSASGSGFRFKASDGGGASTTTTVLDLTRGQTIFYTGGTERARIDSSGRMGIGRTPTTNLLEVAGTIESTSGGFKFPDGTTQTTSASTALPPGIIMPYAGSSAPAGYLMCDGTAVSRTTYANLYAVIGTTYGSGDGSTTFNLPNTQGVFLRGAGTQTISSISYSATLGATQGDQMQGHKHSVTDPGHSHEQVVGAGPAGPGLRFDYVTDQAVQAYPQGLYTIASVTGLTVQNPSTDGTNGTPRTGSETRPANIGVNYIIKT